MSRVCLLLLLIMGWPDNAWAQRPFDEAAKDIQADYHNARKEQRLTLKEIAGRRETLRQRLADLEARVSSASGALSVDRERLDGLTRERDDLTKEVSQRLADNRELSVLFMNHAGNFLALAERSPYSAEHPDRLTALRSFVDPQQIFRLKDLKTLIDLSLEDMAASREKVIYSGTMVDREGNEIRGEIIRPGHFPAMYLTPRQAGYLILSPASGRLIMSSDASWWVAHNFKNYFAGKTDYVYMDISGGAAIQQLTHRVGVMEQLISGGPLVVPILLTGLVALILTIERLIFLGKVRHNTDELMSQVTDLVGKGDIKGAMKATIPHRHRPTGRVLMVGLQHRDDPAEVIESALSEAMLRETPRLERFVGALKACAAVAPLLGLLGTVCGMIDTFQVITIHGSGDPRLMAGGISVAMVTTQVGLVVAIPTMIVAAFLGRRARNLSQDMEEKALALMGTLLRLRTNGADRLGQALEPLTL